MGRAMCLTEEKKKLSTRTIVMLLLMILTPLFWSSFSVEKLNHLFLHICALAYP